MKSSWVKCNKCGEYNNVFETTVCKNCETPLKKSSVVETKKLDRNGNQEVYKI